MITAISWSIALLLSCSTDSNENTPPTPEIVLTQTAEKPDVVLILIDTLRVDHMPFHGYNKDTAPFLTAMSENAAVFSHAWSTSSWTAPSTASVFTGVYPNQHGVLVGFFATEHQANAMGDGEHTTMPSFQLPADLPTLPELFKAAGYQTFGVAGNINIGSDIGFDRGFDQFLLAHQATARELATQLVQWQPQIESGPAFVYAHINDSHAPYLKRDPWYQPQEDEIADMQSAYNSEIRYIDLYIQRLVEKFGWHDDIVMVVSDHGEEFNDHGQLGHLTSLHRELVQALWMVHGPGIAPQRIDENTSLVDVFSTILELGDVPVPDNRSGVSLAPMLRGESEDLTAALAERPVYHHRVERESPNPADWRELWGVTQGEWRLIEEGETRKLYHVNDDITEQNNLVAMRTQTVETMASTLREFRQNPGPSWSQEIELELNPDLYEQLQSMGYVE